MGQNFFIDLHGRNFACRESAHIDIIINGIRSRLFR
jgi:hypothetical protein